MKVDEMKSEICYHIVRFLRNPLRRMHKQTFDLIEQWRELTEAERREIIYSIAEYAEHNKSLSILSLLISCLSLIISVICYFS